MARRSPNAPHHPRNSSPLGAMKRFAEATGDRKALASYNRKIRAAMEVAKGSPAKAAAVLGLSVRQMYRVLADPMFADVQHAAEGRPKADA